MPGVPPPTGHAIGAADVRLPRRGRAQPRQKDRGVGGLVVSRFRGVYWNLQHAPPPLPAFDLASPFVEVEVPGWFTEQSGVAAWEEVY